MRPAWPGPRILEPRLFSAASIAHSGCFPLSACVLTVCPPNLCWAKQNSNHKQPSFPRPLCHSDREEAAGPRGPPDPGLPRVGTQPASQPRSRQAGSHGAASALRGGRGACGFPTPARSSQAEVPSLRPGWPKHPGPLSLQLSLVGTPTSDRPFLGCVSEPLGQSHMFILPPIRAWPPGDQGSGQNN